MGGEKLTVLEQVYSCIKENKNFVLQGGAGSGKTESLKRVLEHISSVYPDKKIACITHTNLAVDEIISRVGNNDYTISTIHSFLNNLIKDYKKNIHQVIDQIFILKKVENLEHNEYKKCYEKYASTFHTLTKETIPRVIGKRIYDKEQENYNDELNEKIESLNTIIKTTIKEADYNIVKYNDTRFDSFKDLSFGHDNLLKITSLLFEEHSLLSKILQDKFDFILIDEYQDTSKSIIDIFLNKIPVDSKTVIGLFGDSMQGIYDDGIGSVENYIQGGALKKIEKEDNYRCSEQVVNFINQLRNDGLEQEVAFKADNGVTETINDRKGFVKLYYSIYTGDRTPSGIPRDKEGYSEHLNKFIEQVENSNPNFKKLMLTNKSIAIEVGFENLYKVFNDRYTDVKEEIQKDLARLQFLDLANLSKAYNDKNYNFVITELKKSGFILSNSTDKEKISKVLNTIINSDKGAFEVLKLAFENKVLKKSDAYNSFISRKDGFLSEIKKDSSYTSFKTYFVEGKNTFTKMKAEIDDLVEEVFKENEKIYKKERFFEELFSNKIKFKEIVNYSSYLNEDTNYITMHKTKGSGIKNVLIILDEYFWSKYKFKLIFDSQDTDPVKKIFNQKLFYVASSRAIENLICLKIITLEEKEDLIRFFTVHEEIKI